MTGHLKERSLKYFTKSPFVLPWGSLTVAGKESKELNKTQWRMSLKDGTEKQTKVKVQLLSIWGWQSSAFLFFLIKDWQCFIPSNNCATLCLTFVLTWTCFYIKRAYIRYCGLVFWLFLMSKKFNDIFLKLTKGQAYCQPFSEYQWVTIALESVL